MAFGFSLKESIAICAGFGWYSYAPAIITAAGPQYAVAGAVAFLHNVMRETAGIIFIPLVARKLGYLEAISIPGIGTMDVCMPIVEQSCRQDTVVYGFVSGFCSAYSRRSPCRSSWGSFCKKTTGLQLVDGWMNMIHIFQSLVFLRSFFFCGFLFLALLLSQGGWIRQYGLEHHVAGGVLQRCELDHIDLVAGAFQFEPPQSVGQDFRELIL